MKHVIRNGKLVSLPTVPVTDCRGCGACCRHMGTPPGYAAFYPQDGVIPEYAVGIADHERWEQLPPAVEAELRAYYEGVRAGNLMDRTRECVSDQEIATAVREGRLAWAQWRMHTATRNPIPCLWYDESTARCRHYDHRPETCRDAIAPGDEACLATRRAFRVPLPLVPETTRCPA